MAAGRLTISSITADAAPRNIDRPRPNHRPLYEMALKSAGNNAEKLLETLRNNGASEKLVNDTALLLTTAKAAGVEKQVMRVLRMYATDIKNDIINLMLRRMDDLVKGTERELLTQRLEQCAELMREFQDAADAVPALLSFMQHDLGSSFNKLTSENLRELIGKSLAETDNGPCPHSVHRTMRKKIKKGEFNHISVIAQVKDRIPDGNGTTKNIEPQGFNKDADAAEGLTSIQTQGVWTTGNPQTTTQFEGAPTARTVYMPLAELWADQPKRGIGGDDDSQMQIEAVRTVKESRNAERKEKVQMPRLVWSLERARPERKAVEATAPSSPIRSEKRGIKERSEPLREERGKAPESAPQKPARNPAPVPSIAFLQDRPHKRDDSDYSAPKPMPVRAARKKAKPKAQQSPNKTKIKAPAKAKSDIKKRARRAEQQLRKPKRGRKKPESSIARPLDKKRKAEKMNNGTRKKAKADKPHTRRDAKANHTKTLEGTEKQKGGKQRAEKEKPRAKGQTAKATNNSKKDKKVKATPLARWEPRAAKKKRGEKRKRLLLAA